MQHARNIPLTHLELYCSVPPERWRHLHCILGCRRLSLYYWLSGFVGMIGFRLRIDNGITSHGWVGYCLSPVRETCEAREKAPISSCMSCTVVIGSVLGWLWQALFKKGWENTHMKGAWSWEEGMVQCVGGGMNLLTSSHSAGNSSPMKRLEKPDIIQM